MDNLVCWFYLNWTYFKLFKLFLNILVVPFTFIYSLSLVLNDGIIFPQFGFSHNHSKKLLNYKITSPVSSSFLIKPLRSSARLLYFAALGPPRSASLTKLQNIHFLPYPLVSNLTLLEVCLFCLRNLRRSLKIPKLF